MVFCTMGSAILKERVLGIGGMIERKQYGSRRRFIGNWSPTDIRLVLVAPIRRI